MLLGCLFSFNWGGTEQIPGVEPDLTFTLTTALKQILNRHVTFERVQVQDNTWFFTYVASATDWSSSRLWRDQEIPLLKKLNQSTVCLLSQKKNSEMTPGGFGENQKVPLC